MTEITFPKVGEKHRLVPLFNPGNALGGKRIKKQERAILIYSRNLEKVMGKELGFSADKGLSELIPNPERIYVCRSVKGLLVIKLGIGAPLTAVVAEELYAAGVKEILIMGIAGSLSRKLDFGDLVLCDRAVRDEGTSHHYLKNSLYVSPSSGLTRRVGRIVDRLGIKYVKGTTWTIDAPYMETVHEVKHYRKKGVLTVEMEAAALFAIAKKRGKGAAALFTISDILDPEGWSGFDEHGKRIRKREAYPKMVRIAREFGKG
jgi:uridine phosphorylase